MKTLVVILVIALFATIYIAICRANRYEITILEQAETIRILQEQVNDLRSRLFEFRAMVGGVG
jgi:Na+-transporting NADH:ubiquinone oxidoreductase subunit NqrB